MRSKPGRTIVRFENFLAKSRSNESTQHNFEATLMEKLFCTIGNFLNVCFALKRSPCHQILELHLKRWWLQTRQNLALILKGQEVKFQEVKVEEENSGLEVTHSGGINPRSLVWFMLPPNSVLMRVYHPKIFFLAHSVKLEKGIKATH